jgi:hypothetical protein
MTRKKEKPLYAKFWFLVETKLTVKRAKKPPTITKIFDDVIRGGMI